MHSEFERTPKSASGGPTPSPTRQAYSVRIHWPYVLTEFYFVVYQLGWVVVFVVDGPLICALGSAYLASCVAFVFFFYGDHAGRVCFVFEKRQLLAWRRAPRMNLVSTGRLQ